MVVGKSSDFRSTFVHLPGEGSVRKIDSAVRSRFDVGDGWRDKTILDIGDMEGITRLIITGPSQTMVFERRQSVAEGDEAGEPEDSVV